MIGRESDGTLTVHVGTVDVLCRAKLILQPNGTMKVSVQDGVRGFELSREEVAALFLELSRQDQDRRSGLGVPAEEGQ